MFMNSKRFVSGPLGVVLVLAGASLLGCEGKPAGQQSANTPAPQKVANNTPAKPAPVVTPAASNQKVPPPPPTLSSSSPVTTLNPSSTTPTSRPPVPPAVSNQAKSPSTIQLSPSVLDLGIIPTGDTGLGTVQITNTGKEAIVIERAKTSCGCTTAKLVPNTPLAPGETVEMDIRLKGGLVATNISKTVDILVTGQVPKRMQVKAKAVAFVTTEPTALDPKIHLDGKLVFTSKDGTPFRITSMQPALITEFPSEPQTEVTINIPYDKWRSERASAKLVFYTDHPKCNNVRITMVRSPADVQAAAKNSRNNPPPLQTRTPNGPSKSTQAAVKGTVIDPETLIRSGQGDQLLQYIAAGTISIENANAKGTSMLSMAARAGNTDLVLGLLDAGAAIETSDSSGMTPLMYASEVKNNVETVRALLDAGADVNSWGSGNWTPMITSVRSGDSAIVQELLDAGARLDVAQPVTGWTPLFWAVIGNGDAKIIDLLVAAGDQLETEDVIEGATPLIRAASTGRRDILMKLVKLGAQLEAKDRNGKTALLSAAAGSGGTPDKIEALIAAGANINATDNRGLNALDFARKRTDINAQAVIDLLEKHLKKEDAPASGSSRDASGQ